MLSSWAFLDLIVILAFIFIEFVTKQIVVILQSKIDIILKTKRECSNRKSYDKNNPLHSGKYLHHSTEATYCHKDQNSLFPQLYFDFLNFWVY